MSETKFINTVPHYFCEDITATAMSESGMISLIQTDGFTTLLQYLLQRCLKDYGHTGP